MAQQLVKIEPVITPIGDDSWQEEWPNAYTFNLTYQILATDSRKGNPKDGYNQEIWLIKGSQEDVDTFVGSDVNIVKLTPTEAETLASVIRPGGTTTCLHCGGTGTMTVPPWPSPI